MAHSVIVSIRKYQDPKTSRHCAKGTDAKGTDAKGTDASHLLMASLT